MPMRRAAGFTLIELMVTIGIAAILLALALPTFTESIRSNRVSTATNQMLATINLARAEAVRSKSQSWVCPSNDTRTDCGANWTDGMLVWTDEDGNGARTTAEIKRVIEPQEGIALTMGTISAIGFDDRGRAIEKKPTGAVVSNFNFSMKAATCKAGAANVRSFDINRIGRVSVTRGNCP
ncbi:GspH/FimT family pseudopilin [Lysobacter sp. CA196]|uniref:GspH/FimT family pseudopilin n=1 Tax=Lysobacter sp. CA196 TaxID=3455606 RepID=UPI003F8D6CD4